MTRSVLFLVKNSALNRGMATVIENLAWSLAELGCDVSVMAGGSQPDIGKLHYPKDVKYYFTGGDGAANDLSKLYSELFEINPPDCVVGRISSFREILEAQRGNPRRPVFIANQGLVALQHEKKSVRTVLRSLVYGVRRRSFISDFTKLIQRNRSHKIYDQLDVVVSISNAVKKSVEVKYGINQSRSRIIYREINTELFSIKANYERIFSNETALKLIFSGRVTRLKGVFDVIDSMKYIKFPNIELHLCGSVSDADRQLLEESISSLSPSHIVKFHGALDQSALHNKLIASDVFVFPSTHEVREGLGKSVLEAMACGLPVVASSIDPVAEVIQHEVNGLIFEASNPLSLANEVNKFLANKSLAISCALRARDTVVSKFSRQMEANSWFDLIEKQHGLAQGKHLDLRG